MSIRERYEDELERLVDRLRSMSLARLGAELPPFPSRAEAVRSLTVEVANTALSCEGIAQRDVPRLGDECVGDQLAVIGRDLLTVCSDEGVLEGFTHRFREMRLAL